MLSTQNPPSLTSLLVNPPWEEGSSVLPSSHSSLPSLPFSLAFACSEAPIRLTRVYSRQILLFGGFIFVFATNITTLTGQNLLPPCSSSS
jgi:hypothetical protein